MKKHIFILNILLICLLLILSVVPDKPAQASGTPSLPILFGAYPGGPLQTSAGELTAMNTWLTGNGASGVTFAGTFVTLTFNPSWNVGAELGGAWNAGFIPFVNLMPSEGWEGSYYKPNCDTAYDIAAGSCDSELTTWANLFKTWAGTTKRAFIAPMPEMNGNWTAYYSDGATFINAFIRIRQIFESAGVPRSAVRWVFAPNGWSNTGNEFEKYYPGDAYVDIISFSAYNYGGCPSNFPVWTTFETEMKLYLDRMRLMAPSKPIFISQTGVLGVPVNGGDPTQTKSAWIQDTFSKLANYPAVRAIIYFNIQKPPAIGNCSVPDFRIFYGGSSGEAGFLNIMKDTRFGKWAAGSANWSSIVFGEVSYTFEDVQPNHPFLGEPNIWYYTDVHKLYNNHITSGCTISPLRYCPEDSVTRSQMSVFILKGVHGSNYSPPAVGSGTGFADVPTNHWAAAWIKQLAIEGITGGCGGSNYCPEASVTRAQMAVFLLKAKHTSTYNPPNATGVFIDVPVNYWASSWIERFAVEGITSGCGGGNFCPDNALTRAQMAVFLVKTFNLP